MKERRKKGKGGVGGVLKDSSEVFAFFLSLRFFSSPARTAQSRRSPQHPPGPSAGRSQVALGREGGGGGGINSQIIIILSTKAGEW